MPSASVGGMISATPGTPRTIVFSGNLSCSRYQIGPPIVKGEYGCYWTDHLLGLAGKTLEFNALGLRHVIILDIRYWVFLASFASLREVFLFILKQHLFVFSKQVCL